MFAAKQALTSPFFSGFYGECGGRFLPLLRRVCWKPWHLMFARHNDAAGDGTVLVDACQQQTFCHLLFHLLVWHVVALLDPESNLGPMRAPRRNAPLIESFVDCCTVYIAFLFTWLLPLTSFFLYLFFLTYFFLLIFPYLPFPLRIGPLLFQVRGCRRQPNLGLSCFSLFWVILFLCSWCMAILHCSKFSCSH